MVAVTEGYLLLRGYDAPYDVYKIQITNPQMVVKLNAEPSDQHQWRAEVRD